MQNHNHLSSLSVNHTATRSNADVFDLVIVDSGDVHMSSRSLYDAGVCSIGDLFWILFVDAFRLVYDIRFCRVDMSCSGVQHLWFCFFCFCCVLLCVLLLLLLVVLLAVLEFENGSREEELLLFFVS